MAEIRYCSVCQVPIASDAPEGICPSCLARRVTATAAWVGPSTAGLGSRVATLDPLDLAGHFPQLEIRGLLGRGGMGAVYQARQPGLDRVVALKILRPDLGRDSSFAERFGREARVLARLGHPHIVAVYDYGEADGLYYFVMELVDGTNLRQFLHGRRLPPGEALPLLLQVCDALAYAHGEGVIHRDVKPENILVDRKGRVKLADFGLAKLADPADPALTVSQQIMGTPRYMAPEQMERPAAVDHRADLYALGVVLYEMLTGELPVGRFPAPSEIAPVDARLDAIALRALEKDPARRYQQANELKVDLEQVLRGPAPAPQAGRTAWAATAARVTAAGDRPVRSPWVSRAWAAVRRHPVRWAAGLVLGVVALIFFQTPRPGVDTKVVAGRTALMEATRRGDVALVRQLLDRGAEVNAKDGAGQTPLMEASYQGATAVVRRLLERGAEVNDRDNEGNTALMFAAHNGHEAVVDALLAARARVNARHTKGWTALQMAASQGQDTVVEQLIARGAEVNTRDQQGRSPLHVAAGPGHLACVQRLLKGGAEVNARDEQSANALAYAVAYGRHAVADLLVARGAEDDGTLALQRAYELAVDNRHADAVPHLVRALEGSKRQPGSGRTWYFAVRGWQYQTSCPAVFVSAVLGECYHKAGQPQKAGESFAAARDSWPRGADTLKLYVRWLLNQPGLEVEETYTLSLRDLQNRVKNPAAVTVLHRSREDTRFFPGGKQTDTRQETVKGLIH